MSCEDHYLKDIITKKLRTPTVRQFSWNFSAFPLIILSFIWMQMKPLLHIRHTLPLVSLKSAVVSWSVEAGPLDIHPVALLSLAPSC